MARPKKDGLDYFPLDVDCNDKGIKLLQAKYGLMGFAVVVKIWQLAYKNGYYCSWDEDEQILFSQENNIEMDPLNEIVEFAISKNLFNEEIFRKHRVLTSSGVQKRYITACVKRKDLTLFSELLCINLEEMVGGNGKTIIKLKKISEANLEEKVNSGETSVNPELIQNNSEKTPVNTELIQNNSEKTLVNSEEMPQSKVKKSKVKESKVEGATTLDSIGDKINSGETKGAAPATISWQEVYKKNINSEIEPALEGLFEGYINNGLEAEVVKGAITEAVKAGAKSPAYIDKILRNCIENKVLDIKSFRARTEKWSNCKNRDKPGKATNAYISHAQKEEYSADNLNKFYK